MAIKDEEEERLRSVALQNAESINLARRRAEETLRKQSEWLRVTLSILANHTILIAKDGTEYPIDDSAAPIRNDQGEVAGVVLVFRDITSRKVEEAAQTERTRLVALRGDVSAALASSQSTPSALELCCEAFILHLNVAFAGIWTLRGPDSALQSQARAGLRIDLTGLPEQIPVGQFNIGMVVRTREPYLTNAVADDPNVSNAEWAKLTQH